MSRRGQHTRPRYRRESIPSSRKSPVRQRAEELLADGEWHSYEKIISQLIPIVTPGVAAREAEARRQASAARKAAEVGVDKTMGATAGRVKKRALSDQIRTGARSIVTEIFRSPIFEVDPSGRLHDPSIRRVRLTPYEMSSADFSAVQLEVMSLFGTGMDSLEIAQKLGLRTGSQSNNGARPYFGQVARKLGAAHTPGAVFRLRELNILPPAGPMSEVDRLVATTFLAYRINSMPAVAERLSMPVEVVDAARRRLYCRYGVHTMPELRVALDKDLTRDRLRTDDGREQLRREAAELYQAGKGGVRAVAEQMGLSYGAVYDLLREAEVVGQGRWPRP